MKKIWKLVTVISIISVLIVIFTGCGLSDDDSVITWEISQEAEAVRDVLMDERMENFDEEAFDELMEIRYNTRTVQEFPDTKVKGILKKETFKRNDLYTLEDESGYENIVLYIHGGAWTAEIDALHVEFCDELVERLDSKVYMPLYPLAPEASYYDTYRMIAELYKELLKQNKPIFVMGDSAGGNISLGLMHLIKKYDYDMPDKLVLLSPCTDMTFSNEEMKEIEATDPVLNIDLCRYCAKMWAYEKELDDPLLSAQYADTSKYPDTLLFTGTNDILYPDIFKFYEKMKEKGNDITLVKGEGLWHVFAVFDIPEKEKSLILIEEFCRG